MASVTSRRSTDSVADSTGFPRELSGNLNKPETLDIIPRSLLRFESWSVNAPVKDEDLDILRMEYGFRFMKRLNQNLNTNGREPNRDDFVAAATWGRNFCNHGINLYLSESEHRIVTYVREKWIKPPNYVELVTSFSDVLKLVPRTLSPDENSRYWPNWDNFYYLNKVAWEDGWSNEGCARVFEYRYLNEVAQCKTSSERKRSSGTGPSDIDGEFWRQLCDATSSWENPVTGGAPLQSGFIARLNQRRRNKYEDVLVKKVEEQTGCIFRIQGQRKRKQTPVYQKMMGKKVLWTLFKSEIHTVVSPDASLAHKRSMEEAEISDGGGSLEKEPRMSRMSDCVEYFKTKFDGELSAGTVIDFVKMLRLETGVDIEGLERMGEEVQVGSGGSRAVSSVTNPTIPASPNLLSTNGDNEESKQDDEDDELTFLGTPSESPLQPHLSQTTAEQEGLEMRRLEYGSEEEDDDCVMIGAQDPVPVPVDIGVAEVAADETNESPQPTRSTPRKSAGKKKIDNDVDFQFDEKSYKVVCIATKTDCSACYNGSSGMFFECIDCHCNHKICFHCMKNGCELKHYDRCNHNGKASYEVQTKNQRWMSGCPIKMCSKCCREEKISRKNPMFYCRECNLHRLCKGCYEQLADAGSEYGRRTRRQCNRQ